MKVIFLYGLGQDASSWNEVVAALPDCDCLTLELFDDGRLPDTFEVLQKQVRQELDKLQEDFVLVGISLGAVVSLSFLEKPPQGMVAAVSSAGQYRLAGNRLYALQRQLFKLMPKALFIKQGGDKGNLIRFYQSLEQFDLTDALNASRLPCLVVCGDKDRANLRAAKEMAALLPRAQLEIIKGGRHELNRQKPSELAELIKVFLQTLKNG